MKLTISMKTFFRSHSAQYIYYKSVARLVGGVCNFFKAFVEILEQIIYLVMSFKITIRTNQVQYNVTIAIRVRKNNGQI